MLAAIRNYFNDLGAKSTLKPKYDIHNIEEALTVRSVSRFSVKQHDVVITFLNQYPLRTRKALDFEDWKSVMIMYKEKLHLTTVGRAQMEALKRGMNTGRK